MTAAIKAAKWLLSAAAIIIVSLFLADNVLGWSPFETKTGHASIGATGPRYTGLEPADFACHVYGETRFVQSGLKEPDTTRVGVGHFGIDFSHGDMLIAFLAVVGQFELCADAEDQRVWHDGQTLFAEVERIRYNRPALTFGNPADQAVPSCSAVLKGDANMQADPSEFDRTHYLCTGGITLDQGESAGFYQTLQAYAEWNVGRSDCASRSLERIKQSITDHYQRQASQLGLELNMVGLDRVYIASDPAAQPPTMDKASFDVENDNEVCN